MTRSIAVISNALLGMWFALAAITMLFVGLTSAYIARRGLDPQWAAISAPSAALPACALLIASSITLELGRKRRSLGWLVTTWVLGLAFIGAQVVACRELSTTGLYLSTSPHSSFFYLFTALHALHVSGGIVALTWAMCVRATLSRINVIGLYWHAMTIVWVYLLAVLFAWS